MADKILSEKMLEIKRKFEEAKRYKQEHCHRLDPPPRYDDVYWEARRIMDAEDD